MRSLSLRAGILSLALCLYVLSFAPASAQTIIATIPVEGSAGPGYVDWSASLAYIPVGGNGTSGQVAIVNERNQTVAGYISIDTSWPALTVAFNPKTGLLYVGAESGGLFEVNPKTGVTVAYVNVNAASVAVNQFTNKIYVSDFESNVYVIDGATNNIEATIPVNGLQNIAVNPFTNRIYAAMENFIYGGVAVIDGSTNQIIAQPHAGSGLSFDVAVDPFRNMFYSSDTGTTGSGSATLYNGKTNTQAAVVPITGEPAGLVQDPVTNTVYVVSDVPGDFTANGTLEVIDGATRKIIDSLTVGAYPQYMTDDPVNKLLYVGCEGPVVNGYPTYYLEVIRTR